MLVEKGAAMTVGEVAERAGVAKGTVYLYFETKMSSSPDSRLATAALVDAAHVLVDGPEPHLARLEAFLRSMVDLHVSAPRSTTRLFHGTGMRDDAALHELAALLRSFIEDGVAARSFTRRRSGLRLGVPVARPARRPHRFRPSPRGSKSRFVSSCLESTRRLLGRPDTYLCRDRRRGGVEDGRVKPRPRRRRRWPFVVLGLGMVAALAVVAAIVLPGDDDGVTHPDDWDPRVLDLVHFVEDDRGLLYEHPVTIDFLTAEEYTAGILERDELTDEDVEDLEQAEAELRAMGLVTGDVDLVEALARRAR